MSHASGAPAAAEQGRAGFDPSLLVIVAGLTAAFHVGKLPPALPALRESLGVGLVQAGFLISLVQLAGMSLGLFVGLAADSVGLRRTMVAGLLLLSAASMATALTRELWLLLVLRAVEGLGFLLAAMPAPGLVRRLVPPQRLSARLGMWGAYMPIGTALALLVGPTWIAHWGWPAWWWLAGLLSLAAAAGVWLRVEPDPGSPKAVHRSEGEAGRLRQTLRAKGPWLMALAFACYSAQWLSVIGFLPTVYAQAGLSPHAAGLATAAVAAVNIVGNVAGGRLLQHGAAPQRVLRAGFGAMALGGLLAFAPLWPAGSWAAMAVPYGAVLCFSMVGGLVPGTLFALSVRLAPGSHTVSTTVGWMQQWSSIGQFLGPPLVAWVASRVGDWGYSGVVTAACAAIGLALTPGIGRLYRRAVATTA